MSAPDSLTTWRDEHGALHVECRFRFTDSEQMTIDIADAASLGRFDRRDSSLADRLKALSILVRVKEAKAQG